MSYAEIASLRHDGFTFKSIGKILARRRGRPLPYLAATIEHTFRRCRFPDCNCSTYHGVVICECNNGG